MATKFGMKSPAIQGGIGGAAASLGARYGGQLGSIAGTYAAGLYTKNDTLKSLAGFQAGSMLAEQTGLGSAPSSRGYM